MERLSVEAFLLMMRSQAVTVLRRPVTVLLPRTLGRWRRQGAPLRLPWPALLALAVVSVGAGVELRTAALEARLLATVASGLDYRVEPGPSREIVFPRGGPVDESRGYSRVPEFTRRLEERGYEIKAQARCSPAMALVSRLGISPPYEEPAVAGLVIRGMGGEPIYDATAGRRVIARLEDVPPVVIRTLLYIENRELDRNQSPYSNPAVDWGRFGKAVLLYSASRFGLPASVEGGSTLAVQLEKYRHFPGGRTRSGVDKLRQMLGATLRAYKDGPRTTAARRRIILDYLNTVPLGGAPGYGEIEGLEDGLKIWFGAEPSAVYRALQSRRLSVRARATKKVLALLCAVRAPSRYLTTDRQALERRVNSYALLLGSEGILDPDLGRRITKTPLRFSQHPGALVPVAPNLGRDARRVRYDLVQALGLRDTYELDRLHLTVLTTIDPSLQRDVQNLFRDLGDSSFVASQGLRGPHLLNGEDPRQVVYSFLLCERTPDGNVVRVHADNLEHPFDIIEGMKLELGSTAKLRTLVHYLEIVSRLYDQLSGSGTEALLTQAQHARDPITAWSAVTLAQEPGLDREGLLERALDRTYSASPYELFFTGGGYQTFRNFDPDDNGRTLTVREGAAHSTNLVFVRLMRDLVRYHAAQLPYDTRAILQEDGSPARLTMLHEVADEEGSPDQMGWLFRTHNRRAQDNRLRAKIERDAFARMSPYWRQLGFPFPRLVPSYATAIGSSGDRPAALADLMGILMNDGVRRPATLVREIRFASGTPYETTLEPPVSSGGETVLEPSVARVARRVLADVVATGTAVRLRGAFTDSTGQPVWIGGKTGTGDNRYERFGRGRRLIESRAVNRTATFTFCLGDRYYGVLTAAVLGPQAARYSFTSSLPLAVMQLLAPSLEHCLDLHVAPAGAVVARLDREAESSTAPGDSLSEEVGSKEAITAQPQPEDSSPTASPPKVDPGTGDALDRSGRREPPARQDL